MPPEQPDAAPADWRARLEHLNRVLKAIRNVNQLITQAKDRDALLRGACECLTETRGYCNAWIALFDEADPSVATHQSGLGDRFAPMRDLLRRNERTRCMTEALGTDGVVVTADPPSSCADCPLAPMYAGRRGLTARLAYDGEVYGVLSVSVPTELIDDAEERELFAEVAGDIGYALHALKAEAERERLRASLVRANRIVEQSPAVLFRWRAAEGWPVEYVSENVARFGYASADFTSGRLPYAEIVHPGDFDRVAAEVGRHATGEASAFRQEYRILDATGETRWVDDRTTVERDEAGRPVAFQGVLLEITDLKRAEAETRAAETRYRTLFEKANNPVLVADAQGRYVDANEAALRFLETDRETLLTRTVWDYAPPGERERQQAEHAPFTGLRTLETDYQVGAQRKTLLLNVVPVPSEDGPLMYGIGLDVTREKAAEAALRRQHEMLARTERIAAVGSWEWIAADDRVFWSDQVFRIFGREPAPEAPSFTDHRDWYAPEDRDRLVEAVEACLHSGEPYALEVRAVRPDGEVRHCIVRGLPEYGPDGTVERLVGSLQDITERKRTEEALRESRERFRLSFDTRHVAWALSRRSDGAYLDANPGFLELTGYAREEVIGRTSTDLGFYTPARRRDLAERIERHGRLDSEELTFSTKQGQTRTILFSIAPVEVKGEACLSATMVDITERKRTEEALRESEKVMRYIIKHDPNALAVYDNDLRYIAVSDRYLDDYEVADRDIPGKHHYEVFPEMPERWKEVHRRVLQGAVERNDDDWFERPDGSITYNRWECRPWRKADGSIGGMITYTEVTTARKLAELALKESEARYRGIVEQTGDALVVHDLEGNILDVNDFACEQYGYTREELLGMKVSDLDPDYVEREDDGAFWEGMELYEPRVFEAVQQHRDGRVFPVEVRVSLIQRGSETVALGFCRDVTERRQLEDRLRQMEKMEAIGQLAGGVAHDFNNQLAGVMGYADMLEARLEDPTLKRYAESILVGARRAADLTRQLLAFARKGQYRSVRLDLHAVIGEVVSILRHTIDRRIEIRRILQDAPACTTGDPSQIQSAVLNLALNARDAMPEGGELVFQTETVALDAAYCANVPYEIEPGRYVRLSVTDSGCGMDEETRRRIFEPFFTTKDVGKGTGMGLAAVYGTVKHHGGAVNVYSEPGRGSTFRLYLPAASLEDEARAADDDRPPPGPPARILLVDDEDLFRNLGHDMLSAAGHTVKTKKNGASAVAWYEKHWREIDLVILDMVMPKMDGAAAFRAMQAINPDVRALLASGYSLNGEAQGLLKEGVCGFVQKPFSEADLMRAAAEALRRGGA